MFTEPVLSLDKEVLTNHLSNVKSAKEALMSKLNYDKADLMSNPKLAELLVFHGVDVPMKISPATGKETYAFAKNDEAFKALLDHENPQVQAIVAARLGVKSTLEETRTERFIKIAERGTLPVPLRYYAAHTGRWGGDDKVNLQNLPRKSPLKKAMRAPDGYSFIDCDSSQIEARTLAWLAGQYDLVDAFDKGEDVYKIMASSIYGVPVDEVTDPQRFVGKTTILGAGYGMGAVKFQAQLKTFGVDMPAEECKRIITVYRETYPMIPKLWRQAGDALDAMANNQTAPIGLDGVLVVYGKDGIKLPNGLSLKYPNMRYIMRDGKSEMVYDQKKGRAVIPTRIYGGKLVENICQALARIVIGEQMLMVARRLRVVMTVHDAVGAIAPTGKAAEAREYVEQCMRIRPKWATLLPLNCESKMGVSYGG
jgi:DNA polymerase